MNRTLMSRVLLCVVLSLITTVIIGDSHACTRVLYNGLEGTVLTGRTMDWENDLVGSDLWVFPRGMKRTGAAGPNSIKWTSRYGSVIASAFDCSTSDGMNEEGLVANVLYLEEAEYVTPSEKDPRRTLSISAWAQFMLDNYATVDKAVKAMEKESFYIVPTMIPGGEEGQLHLSISDATGDSAIIEYVHGKQVIYHDKKYQVLANSPTYEKQLVINAYWEEIGGLTMLPGTNKSIDCFVRASFYIKAIPQTKDMKKALAGVFSVIRNISGPMGISTPEKPNISSTLWRSVADQKNKVYFFESAMSPAVLWVDLTKMDISKGAATKRLALTDGKFRSGDQSDSFEETEPFVFLEARK